MDREWFAQTHTLTVNRHYMMSETVQFRSVGFVQDKVYNLDGYPSGQRGLTVNQLAEAFEGSNPSPSTIYIMGGG